MGSVGSSSALSRAILGGRGGGDSWAWAFSFKPLAVGLMHLQGRDVPDGLQAHRITGSQHMGLRLLQQGAGDERCRAASVRPAGAFSTEVKAGSDTVGSCIVTEQVCYVHMLNLYT